MKKRDSLTGQICIFHAEQTPKKLSRSLRFVRKGIAAATHADPNENSYAVSYAFTVSFLLLQLINHVECWSLNPCADCSFIIDSREKNEP